MHLTRAHKRFNLKAAPAFEGLQLTAKDHVRVLGVQIDTKLKWGPHMAKVKEKAASQLLAIGRITSSTWGAGFIKSKLISDTVIKPTLLYGAGVWYGPQGTVTARKTIDKQMEVIQNQFLRKSLGAYRAVGARILEKESDTPPVTITLDQLAAKAVRRQATSIGGRTVR